MKIEFTKEEAIEAVSSFGFVALILKKLDLSQEVYDEVHEQIERYLFYSSDVMVRFVDGTEKSYLDVQLNMRDEINDAYVICNLK